MSAVQPTDISRAGRPLDANGFDRPVRASRERNSRAGITGVLCHVDPFHPQVLEVPSGP